MPITINIKTEVDELKQLYNFYSDAEFRRKVSTGINRTVEQGRTVARKAVKSIYTISQAGLAGAVELKKSTPRTLTAYVMASAKPVPMQEFKHQFTSLGGSVQRIYRRSKNGKTIHTGKRTASRNLGTFVLEAQRGKKVSVPYAFIIPTSTRWIFGRGNYKSGGSWGFHQRAAGEDRPRTNSGGTNEKVTPLTSVTVHAAAINIKSQQMISDKLQSIFLDKIIHELAFGSIYDVASRQKLKK